MQDIFFEDEIDSETASSILNSIGDINTLKN